MKSVYEYKWKRAKQGLISNDKCVTMNWKEIINNQE